MISIILPVWNGENYLGFALDSLARQSYTDFEVIIVNDSSTDRTIEIATEYCSSDNRFLLINNPTNLKLPGALNVGFMNSRGDWLTWTSHDNYMSFDYLEKMYTAAISLDADFIYANFSVVDESGVFLKSNIVGKPEDLYSTNVIGASFLYKREVYDVIGLYNTKSFMFEDYEYWFEVFRHNFKMIPIEDQGYFYRQHSDQLTERLFMPKSYLKFKSMLISENPRSNKLVRASMHYDISILAKNNKHYFNSLIFLFKAFWISPKIFIEKLFFSFKEKLK